MSWIISHAISAVKSETPHHLATRGATFQRTNEQPRTYERRTSTRVDVALAVLTTVPHHAAGVSQSNAQRSVDREV